jgi:hypothetical protein
MFWFLDKQTNTPEIYGSIQEICNDTDLKPDNLYTVFGRKKLSEYENECYRIAKRKIKRSKADSFLQ